ncbi:hypothetical protein NW762_005584 [Fusarium torreyae]|uniref:F-box domain-containing protein n=1 Tax=Fusarium torreyae TaxID=1237075 RepID=A0A9W8S3H0_9HYPO|nr:hypothetical protein NW762_005584 [Fusarium torreyae]
MKLHSALALFCLPLVLASPHHKRLCKSFEPKGKYGKRGFSKGTPLTCRVSEGVICTESLAESDGGNKTLCDYTHANIAIKSKATVNVTVSNPQYVLGAVQDAADPKAAEFVDFNETVLLPYHNTEPGIPIGWTGYWEFTPSLQCWEGLLTDCEGDDKDKNGTMVQVCAHRLEGWSNNGSIPAAGETKWYNSSSKEAKEAKGIPYSLWEDADIERNGTNTADDDSAGTGVRDLFKSALAKMTSSTLSILPVLSKLPKELRDGIYSHLERNDIKNLRVTCKAMARDVPLRFDRVFISANSLNIQVFRAIADHEIFRHQVSEIIWDDARLRTGVELEHERRVYGYDYTHPDEAVTANGCPEWFRRGRYDYDDSDPHADPDVDSLEETWAYYKPLLEDQRQVLASNADIEAFQYGLRRFPFLRRVTVTPSTHGRLWQPLYRTPMIRAFPPGFDYPLPKAWPQFDNADGTPIDELPWVAKEEDNDLYSNMYGVGCTPEVYRAKWRGYQLVTRALVEYEDHHISELIIGGHEVQTGLSSRIFDQHCAEHDDLVTLLKRPGFRHLDLSLFTGFIEYEDWVSYKTGLLHDALAQAKDIQHVCVRATTEVENGAPGQDVPPEDVLPLRTIFPIDHWPQLRHFGISNMIVELDDFIGLLAALPPSLRSVEIIHLALGSPEHRYEDLLREIRDTLDWRSRPIEERPRVHMVASALECRVQGDGWFVDVDDGVYSYLYGTGNNPFKEHTCEIYPGRGGTRRDMFDSNVDTPY